MAGCLVFWQVSSIGLTCSVMWTKGHFWRFRDWIRFRGRLVAAPRKDFRAAELFVSICGAPCAVAPGIAFSHRSTRAVSNAVSKPGSLGPGIPHSAYCHEFDAQFLTVSKLCSPDASFQTGTVRPQSFEWQRPKHHERFDKFLNLPPSQTLIVSP
jgi:hypothetical protein